MTLLKKNADEPLYLFKRRWFDKITDFWENDLFRIPSMLFLPLSSSLVLGIYPSLFGAYFSSLMVLYVVVISTAYLKTEKQAEKRKKSVADFFSDRDRLSELYKELSIFNFRNLDDDFKQIIVSQHSHDFQKVLIEKLEYYVKELKYCDEEVIENYQKFVSKHVKKKDLENYL